MTATTVFVILLIGAAIGYRLGIWRAERGIARSSMRRTWSGRAGWRK